MVLRRTLARVAAGVAAVALVGLAASPAAAAVGAADATGDGAVSVRVTLSGRPVETTVTLTGARGDGQEITKKSATDTRGRVTFSRLPSSREWSWTATAQNDGVTFSTDRFALAGGDDVVELLATFPTTTSAKDVVQDAWTVWVDLHGETMAVQQDVALTNSGSAAYIGSTPVQGTGDKNRAAVELPLSAGAADLQDLGRFDPAPGQVGKRCPGVALGQTGAVRTHHQRDVSVGRGGKAEEPLQEDLRRGRRRQVVTADHQGHALVGVVHHHRQVVGRDPVVALQHHVPGGAADPAGHEVVELDHLVDPQPQRRWPAAPAPFAPLAGGEIPAGAGVGQWNPVGRAGGLADLPPGAEALVHPARGAQLGDGLPVAIEARRLEHDRSVGSHPDPGQVGELGLGMGGRGGDSVEVLHAHQPPAASAGA